MSEQVFYYAGPCCEGGPVNCHRPVGDGLSKSLRDEPELAAQAINDNIVYSTTPRLDIAFHEIAHAAAALSVGLAVEKVSRTHAYYTDDGLPAFDQAFALLAGPIGQERLGGLIRQRHDSEWRFYIDRARGEGASGCDTCRACRCVLSERPDITDDGIVALLRASESRCHTFFEDVGLRSRMHRAARRLVDVGELSATQIVEFLSATAADFQRDSFNEPAPVHPEGERSRLKTEVHLPAGVGQ